MADSTLSARNIDLSKGRDSRIAGILAEIEGVFKDTAIGVYRLGQALKRYRAEFDSAHEFILDAKARTRLEQSSIYNYLAVASRFEGRLHDLEAIGYNCPSSVLFAISAQSVPDAVFEAIVVGAKDHKITVKEASQLIEYGRVQMDMAKGQVVAPRRIQEIHKSLPAYAPPPTKAELESLFALKGCIRASMDDSLLVENDEGLHSFPTPADAWQAWRMSWERKPDYAHKQVNIGDMVRVRREDLPTGDNDLPLCSREDWVEVIDLKLWQIKIRCCEGEGWVYRAGITEVMPLESIHYPEDTVPFVPVEVEVVDEPIQAEILARAEAKKILGDRPLWVTPLSIVRRGQSIGRVTDDITDKGCVINWDGEYKFTTWQEFQGVESISQEYWQVMNLLNKFGQPIVLDLFKFALDEFNANADYCAS